MASEPDLAKTKEGDLVYAVADIELIGIHQRWREIRRRRVESVKRTHSGRVKAITLDDGTEWASVPPGIWKGATGSDYGPMDPDACEYPQWLLPDSPESKQAYQRARDLNTIRLFTDAVRRDDSEKLALVAEFIRSLET